MNFRLTDFQCELGMSQLSKIKKFISKRKKIADYYEKKLKNFSKYVHIQTKYKNYKPAYHLILMNLKNSNYKIKDNLFKIYEKK